MKLGRPPLLEAQKKGKITGVRLRDEERSLVEKAAEKSGQGLSEWMRKVLVNAAHAEIASKRINAP